MMLALPATVPPPLGARATNRWSASAAIVLLVVAAASLAPAALAVPAPLFLGASLTVDVGLDTRSLQAVYPASAVDLPGPSTTLAQGCGAGGDRFTADSRGGSFRFRETQMENGCGEARFTLAVPEGASRLTVRFTADRIIRQTSTFPLPVNMTQDLRIYDGNDAQVFTYKYFDRRAEAQPVAQPFSVDVPLTGAMSRQVSVGWFFLDQGENLGQTASNPLFGQSFSATVAQPMVTFSGIPTEPRSVGLQRLGADGDTVRQATHITLAVGAGPPGRAIGLDVRTSDALAFAEAQGPDGNPLLVEEVNSTEAEGVRDVAVASAVVARHGYGEYRFTFLSSTAVRASPAMVPLAAGLVVAPVILGVLAARQGFAFRRDAHSAFRHTAPVFLGALALAAFLYLSAMVWVLTAGQLALLAAWPIEPEAALVYGILLAALAAFFTLAFLWKGQLISAMGEEREQQRRSNRKLEDANRDLERSNRELQEFAYVASHDLREPLRAVAGYTQLLQRRNRGKLDAESERYIGNAVQGALRLQALIDDLLAVARIGPPAQPLGPTPLADAYETALRNLEVAVRESGARIHRSDLPVVLGDPGQMVQLLQNLIANAIKFRDVMRPLEVHVGARPGPHGAWTLAVRDNGIGIDPSDSERIFQIFQRLQARDSQRPGSGIGLSICKKIVEQHGGRIWVESEKGNGAAFFFTLQDAGRKKAEDFSPRRT
jgi:signal transduction histidine kinase